MENKDTKSENMGNICASIKQQCLLTANKLLSRRRQRQDYPTAEYSPKHPDYATFNRQDYRPI